MKRTYSQGWEDIFGKDLPKHSPLEQASKLALKPEAEASEPKTVTDAATFNAADKLADLSVERPEVVEQAQSEESTSNKVEQPCDDLAHVKAVEPKQAEKGQKNPSDGVVDMPKSVATIRVAIHAGDQEHVDQPADAEQTSGEEPDRAGDWLTVIESMGSSEAEQSQDVADRFQVGVVVRKHWKPLSR